MSLQRLLPRPLRRHKVLQALYRSRLVSPVQRMEFNGGAAAWVDLRDAESRAAYLAGEFWPEFMPMVAAFLRDRGVLLDVGANFGLVTFGTLPLVPDADCHLFEPNPRIIPLLQRSAAEHLWARVYVNHCAVTAAPGTSTFHQSPDGAWGHSHVDHDGRGETVPNVVLDDYLDERGIDRVAFAKIDVEGWEPHVLRGLWRSCARGAVRAGFVELAPESLARTGSSAPALLSQLEALGFACYFSRLWGGERPGWAGVSINGTVLYFKLASPLPADFAQGDVLVLHESCEHSAAVRAATGVE